MLHREFDSVVKDEQIESKILRNWRTASEFITDPHDAVFLDDPSKNIGKFLDCSPEHVVRLDSNIVPHQAEGVYLAETPLKNVSCLRQGTISVNIECLEFDLEGSDVDDNDNHFVIIELFGYSVGKLGVLIRAILDSFFWEGRQLLETFEMYSFECILVGWLKFGLVECALVLLLIFGLWKVSWGFTLFFEIILGVHSLLTNTNNMNDMVASLINKYLWIRSRERGVSRHGMW